MATFDKANTAAAAQGIAAATAIKEAAMQVRDAAADGGSGGGSVAAEANFPGAGLDSPGAVELRNGLIAQLGVKVPSNLMMMEIQFIRVSLIFL